MAIVHGDIEWIVARGGYKEIDSPLSGNQYLVTPSDFFVFFDMDAIGSNVEVYLPTAASTKNRILVIKRSGDDAGNFRLRINRAQGSGDLIDGNTRRGTRRDDASWSLISNGVASWRIW